MIFNVGVGDFIAVIDLTIQILGALEQSHGAAPQFQDLLGIFEELKGAIKEAGALDCNSVALSSALRRAGCCIEHFLKKIERYQPHLQLGGSKAKWKDAILKIHWTLFRKEDVNAFRSEISIHLNNIQLLLLSACRSVSRSAYLRWQRAYMCRTALVAERKEILAMRNYMMSADARLNETRTLVATLNRSLSQYATQLRDILQGIFTFQHHHTKCHRSCPVRCQHPNECVL